MIIGQIDNMNITLSSQYQDGFSFYRFDKFTINDDDKKAIINLIKILLLNKQNHKNIYKKSKSTRNNAFKAEEITIFNKSKLYKKSIWTHPIDNEILRLDFSIEHATYVKHICINYYIKLHTPLRYSHINLSNVFKPHFSSKDEYLNYFIKGNKEKYIKYMYQLTPSIQGYLLNGI